MRLSLLPVGEILVLPPVLLPVGGSSLVLSAPVSGT